MNKVAFWLLVFILGVFVGYGWRMHHEIKNWDKWTNQIRQDFMYQVFAKDNATIMNWQDYIFIKRADGSIVIKRR